MIELLLQEKLINSPIKEKSNSENSVDSHASSQKSKRKLKKVVPP